MKIFDAHFHIIDPAFPLVENNNYTPPPFTIKDYKSRTKGLKISEGTVVSGSFQGFDHQYLVHALSTLGKGFYGVANIPFGITDTELEQLDEAGVAAVRFNLKRGGREMANHMVPLANRLFQEFGWHTELYVNSKHLPELKNMLNGIPQFSIDHLGLSKSGLNEVFHWVEKGMKVKATGFGRIDFDPVPVLKNIYEINPNALMFGTDLPSTRAQEPFAEKDLNLILNNFSETALEKILFKNAWEWYSKNF